MAYVRKLEDPFDARAGSRDGKRNNSLSHIREMYLVALQRSCAAFIEALRGTARKVVPPLPSVMALDVLFATMVLTIVRHFWEESITEMQRSEARNPTLDLYRPMLLALMTPRFTLNELCDNVRELERYDPRLSNLVGSPHEAANLLPICQSKLLIEELDKYINRVEVERRPVAWDSWDRALSELVTTR